MPLATAPCHTGHVEQLEIQLKAKVESLLAMAEQADQSAALDGMNLPEEISRRQTRLAAMAAAKAKIEERAQARFEKEQAEYEAKLGGNWAWRAADGFAAKALAKTIHDECSVYCRV